MANVVRVQLLVDALQSGEFEQARDTLGLFDEAVGKVKYCCLGVACEVAIANGLALERWIGANGNVCYADRETPDFESDTDLTTGVAKWYGFDGPDFSNPKLGVDQHGGDVYATGANDDLRADFATIGAAFKAKYIDEVDYQFLEGEM